MGLQGPTEAILTPHRRRNKLECAMLARPHQVRCSGRLGPSVPAGEG